MIGQATVILTITAASIGFIHTVMGPDHYLPFIVMSKARKWSGFKTFLVTFFCGVGHIVSSVILGLTGVFLGINVIHLEAFEGSRGNISAWVLMGFGFVYFVWGVHKAIKNRPHEHPHMHSEQVTHEHKHTHNGEHVHVHEEGDKKSITPWVLFTIFVLGPCEPLIPILMYPAAKHSIPGMLSVTVVFAGVTLSTMLAIVMMMSWGFSFIKLGKAERYAHAMAGGTICLSGMAITLLGV